MKRLDIGPSSLHSHSYWPNIVLHRRCTTMCCSARVTPGTHTFMALSELCGCVCSKRTCKYPTRISVARATESKKGRGNGMSAASRGRMANLNKKLITKVEKKECVRFFCVHVAVYLCMDVCVCPCEYRKTSSDQHVYANYNVCICVLCAGPEKNIQFKRRCNKFSQKRVKRL